MLQFVPQGGFLVRLVFAATLLGAAALLVAACSGQGVEQSSPPQSELSVVYVPARWASAQADSFESLVAATGTVFVGEVTRPLGDRGAPSSLPRPGGPKVSIPVTSFEVRVTTGIIGGKLAGETVIFDQPYGVVDRPAGPVMVLLEGDSPLEVGTSYLFFASARDDGTLTAAPYARFEATADGFEAPPEFRDVPVAEQLRPLDAAEAAARIRGSGE